MDIFSPQSKQEVLENLLNLAKGSSNIPAIKLYLDLIEEQISPEELTTEQALEILREANTPPESEIK